MDPKLRLVLPLASPTVLSHGPPVGATCFLPGGDQTRDTVGGGTTGGWRTDSGWDRATQPAKGCVGERWLGPCGPDLARPLQITRTSC